MKHRSPSPVRRKLFPDSVPRRSSSSLGSPIEETTYKPATSYSSNSMSNGLPPRKFSGLISSLEESSRRSSRATSPFDESLSYSRRSSRATSPFSIDDIMRRRRSSRFSRSSRGSSPFEEDLPAVQVKKGSMQNFIDSLRSRSPSPSSGVSRESPSRRRSSSVYSDASHRASNSPYHTLPRRRSQSPDVRAMSLTSDVSVNTSIARRTPLSDGMTSPSANASKYRTVNDIEI